MPFTFEYVNEFIDTIDVFPGIRKNHEHKELTLGDLHGNFLYFLYLLVFHGVINNMDEDTYNKLRDIYKAVDVDISREFNDILHKIKFNNTIFVRLIGDEVGDRGNNDYFTLKLLEHMHDSGLEFEILVSNHGFEFIKAYETEGNAPLFIEPSFCKSLLNLWGLMIKNEAMSHEVKRIINRVYKVHLKAISYRFFSLSNTLCLYTHAPAGIVNLRSVADFFKTTWEDYTIEDVIQSLDRINTQFQCLLNQNKVHSLMTIEEIQSSQTITSSFASIIWNRGIQHLFRPKYFLNLNTSMIWVHGHDAFGPRVPHHIYNLDATDLGKSQDSNGPHLAFIHNRPPAHLSFRYMFWEDETKFYERRALQDIEEPQKAKPEVIA